MNGFISIKSEEGKGSKFTVVLDQKIATDDRGIIYNKYIFNKKKVLLVSDKNDYFERIKNLTKKYNVEILNITYGQDCIERIKDKENFNLIFLEDEMNPDSALMILKKLKKINHFKSPTVVMLNKDKEKLKDYYIKDGFDDYLLKNNLEEEVKRILKKYI